MKLSMSKHVLWYDDVADISLPVEMLPKDLREAFFSWGCNNDVGVV